MKLYEECQVFAAVYGSSNEPVGRHSVIGACAEIKITTVIILRFGGVFLCVIRVHYMFTSSRFLSPFPF